MSELPNDEPASVAQVSPISDHPHLKRMQEAITEEVKRQGGGGGGNMSDLERRVGNLETDVHSIRDSLSALVTDTAVIKSNYASQTDIFSLKSDISNLKTELKSDISSVKSDIVNGFVTNNRWMIGTLLVAMGIILTIQRLYPPQSSQAPIQTQAASNQFPANTGQPAQQKP